MGCFYNFEKGSWACRGSIPDTNFIYATGLSKSRGLLPLGADGLGRELFSFSELVENHYCPELLQKILEYMRIS